MTKGLIQQLRDLANLRHDDLSIGNEAADLIEAQQKRIDELEQALHEQIDQTMKMRDLIEAQQKRIELYEQALKASWPEGAIGDAFDYWNAARKDGNHD